MAFRKRRDVFDGVPGPSPRYLRAGVPKVAGFEWQAAGDSPHTAGATLLSAPGGPVLVLDFHNYVSLLRPGTLLIWHQRHVQGGQTLPVIVRVLECARLRPLQGTVEELCRAMREEKKSLVFDGSPLCELAIPTVIAEGPQVLSFRLLVARPAEGGFQLYPQEWFNSGGLDYEYQWVTRVARNESTGKIHGEGIRIAPFILDDSLRHTV